jgi:drug/metabolite transporter (DMT)-like permease
MPSKLRWRRLPPLMVVGGAFIPAALVGVTVAATEILQRTVVDDGDMSVNGKTVAMVALVGFIIGSLGMLVQAIAAAVEEPNLQPDRRRHS